MDDCDLLADFLESASLLLLLKLFLLRLERLPDFDLVKSILDLVQKTADNIFEFLDLLGVKGLRKIGKSVDFEVIITRQLERTRVVINDECEVIDQYVDCLYVLNQTDLLASFLILHQKRISNQIVQFCHSSFGLMSVLLLLLSNDSSILVNCSLVVFAEHEQVSKSCSCSRDARRNIFEGQ